MNNSRQSLLLLGVVMLMILIPLGHLAAAPVNPANKVAIAVDKSADGVWTVSYSTSRPITTLVFIRNPDDSRTKRWHPLDKQFIVRYEQGKETIVRKDAGAFSQVKLTLTPSYKHLRKDYAPFSPFSDGGMLFYTGRLFACSDSCDDDENGWQLSLTVPQGEHIIVNGRVHHTSVTWQDKDNGQNVYVGRQQPVETDDVIALIDSGLPPQIRTSLNQDIPKIMGYFNARLGKLPYRQKPTLFASYAKTDGTSSQGGTLPGQIFVHWDGNDLASRVKDPGFIAQTSWFFAHEVAHLYQGDKDGLLDHAAGQSWLHEGNADLLAALALLELYPANRDYVTLRFTQAKKACIAGLGDFPLAAAADKGRFALYYSCGMLIHHAINDAIKTRSRSKEDIYTLWNRYRQLVGQGKPADQQTFLAVVEPLAGKSLSADILTLVDTQLENPAAFIERFIGVNSFALVTAPVVTLPDRPRRQPQ